MTLREMTSETSTQVRKIFNGVCGSRHELTSGFVYDDEKDARIQHWVGLDAFDQSTMWAGDYVRDNAGSHKTRVVVRRRDIDEKGNRVRDSDEEIQNMILTGTSKGRSKVYFDLNKAGEYTVIVNNEATGNCSGGKCKEGSETIERFGREDIEVSNCWYELVIHRFKINENEIEKALQDEQFLNPMNQGNSGRGEGKSDEIPLNAILGLSIGASILIVAISKLNN